jgi:uncharacterized protein (DUF433 family)
MKKITSTNLSRPPKTILPASKKKLMREIYGGEPYEYYRVGRYIVCAPDVCGGRPTFKYTRIAVRHALGLLSAGHTLEEVANNYEIPVKALEEALRLASKALDRHAKELFKGIFFIRL